MAFPSTETKNWLRNTDLQPEQLREFDNHELVVRLDDKSSGLRGFIAIHNSNLGPATGGTRYWYYKTEEEALKDALKLSRAMTFKCAMADVPHGGGKGVIIGDPNIPKSVELLRAYVDQVNSLEGKFTTGEDVGITHDDLVIMQKYSPYVNGRKAGDLAPITAFGVYLSIKEGLKYKFGNESINRRTFAVKGLGKVGMELCKLIYDEGGQITAADLDPQAAQRASQSFPGITIVESADIHRQKAHVFCPCALGSDINEQTASELNCDIICGAENNQLSNGNIGELLMDKNILYIPDFVANAGGLISVSGELSHNGYNKKWVMEKVNNISKTIRKIIKLSVESKKPTDVVAIELALTKIHSRNVLRFS